MAVPFLPDRSAFERVNALYLAHASDVAYQRAPAAAALERLGLEASAFRHRVTRARGYLGVCETHAVLAFRGTDPVTLPSWLTDAVVKLVACQEYEGRVHCGFSSALRRVWADIERVLERAGDKPLFVTGHSMGGALAVLTACRLARLGRPPAVTYRVVNRLDLVPEMPMASLRRLVPEGSRPGGGKLRRRLRELAGRVPHYDHVKTFVYLDRDGAITAGAEVEPWYAHAVARVVATRGRSFHEGITDHLIANYIRGLEGHTGRRPLGVRRRSREV